MENYLFFWRSQMYKYILFLVICVVLVVVVGAINWDSNQPPMSFFNIEKNVISHAGCETDLIVHIIDDGILGQGYVIEPKGLGADAIISVEENETFKPQGCQNEMFFFNGILVDAN
jgi:hypothetical protein